MPYSPGKGFYKVGTKLALSGGKAITRNVITYICNNIITGRNKQSFTIDNTGKLWGWGYNGYGQLGINSVTSARTPVAVLGATKTFCQISAGQLYTIGIDKNGKGWGWGYNSYGQLGDNSTTSHNTPVAILGATKTFCKIAGGRWYTAAIDKNGKGWGWGHNGYGQLGDNSTTQRKTPVSILGATKTFCQIAAGQYHTIGIDKNGKVWCWGFNGSGQLGDNTTTSHRTPVAILGATKTFCYISGGRWHTAAIDKNGQVWSCGDNNKGQLGDNSVGNSYTPVSIKGTTKTFCSIASGDQHVIAIDKNGKVWGWGYNNNGQLGDNSITSHRTPVMITTI